MDTFTKILSLLLVAMILITLDNLERRMQSLEKSIVLMNICYSMENK